MGRAIAAWRRLLFCQNVGAPPPFIDALVSIRFFVTSAVLVIFFRMTISIKVTTIFQGSFGNEL